VSEINLFSLKNHISLVTGGGNGIGAASVRALAQAGSDVVVADIDINSAKKITKSLSDLGVRSMAIKVDVTKSFQVKKMLDNVLETFGRLDIAVNSAGIGNRSPAEMLPEDSWDKLINVNLKSIYLCNREQGKIMLKQRSGSIINIASMSGKIVNRPQNHSHYNASKAGVIQYSRSCAVEWADRGVRVNTISPGHTITNMTAKSTTKMREVWISNTPMARLANPEDIQGAVVFLASSASAYVTGHDLVVDGGYTLW
jgi:NAD(P)-dependent dehydrogenase (short-subunit alcohol dehydrogenase family)